MKGFSFHIQDVIVPEQPPSSEPNEDSISKQTTEIQTSSILNRTNDSGCVIQESANFNDSFYDATDSIFFSKNEEVTSPPGFLNLSNFSFIFLLICMVLYKEDILFSNKQISLV